MIVVLGAGAMGSALATHWARRHRDVILLATERDGAALEAWHHQLPHPALGIPMSRQVPCLPPEDWPGALAAADLVVPCVSSEGLRAVMSRAAGWASGRAVWVMVSKGWQTDATLYSPSELAASILGTGAPVVSMGGPGLAAEIVAGAPTALVMAAADPHLAEKVASTMRCSTLAVAVTDDVAGVETASAYKNVVAIAVGMCEGLSERLGQMAFVHSFSGSGWRWSCCGTAGKWRSPPPMSSSVTWSSSGRGTSSPGRGRRGRRPRCRRCRTTPWHAPLP